MSIISVEIMKTIDQREMQKTTIEKQANTERSKGDRSYSQRVRVKWYCYAFKLGFLQLMRQSIILKQGGWYESNHVAVECGCLNI